MTTQTEPVPFYVGTTFHLFGMEGPWALAYFHSEADAYAYAKPRNGIVVETTQGQIWRVSIRK